MNRGLRVLMVVLGVVLALVLLFGVVFPWVERTFVDDPVMTSAVAGLRSG